jgi:hypothetical protein
VFRRFLPPNKETGPRGPNLLLGRGHYDDLVQRDIRRLGEGARSRAISLRFSRSPPSSFGSVPKSPCMFWPSSASSLPGDATKNIPIPSSSYGSRLRASLMAQTANLVVVEGTGGARWSPPSDGAYVCNVAAGRLPEVGTARTRGSRGATRRRSRRAGAYSSKRPPEIGALSRTAAMFSTASSLPKASAASSTARRATASSARRLRCEPADLCREHLYPILALCQACDAASRRGKLPRKPLVDP